METYLEDQFDSVSEYVATRLMHMADLDDRDLSREQEKKQVNVRLSRPSYDRLVQLAGELRESPTSLATDLLALAISEASGVTLKADQ